MQSGSPQAERLVAESATQPRPMPQVQATQDAALRRQANSDGGPHQVSGAVSPASQPAIPGAPSGLTYPVAVEQPSAPQPRPPQQIPSGGHAVYAPPFPGVVYGPHPALPFPFPPPGFAYGPYGPHPVFPPPVPGYGYGPPAYLPPFPGFGPVVHPGLPFFPPPDFPYAPPPAAAYAPPPAGPQHGIGQQPTVPPPRPIASVPQPSAPSLSPAAPAPQPIRSPQVQPPAQPTAGPQVQGAPSSRAVQKARRPASPPATRPAAAASPALSHHAEERAHDRGVSAEQIAHAKNHGERFEYTHAGVQKIGYYHRGTKVFVATATDGTVLTTMKARSKYIAGLKGPGKK